MNWLTPKASRHTISPSKNRALHGELRQGFLQRPERKIPLVSGDDLALPVLQVRNGPEAIMLQFKNVIGIVEGLFNEAESHRVNAWKHKL